MSRFNLYNYDGDDEGLTQSAQSDSDGTQPDECEVPITKTQAKGIIYALVVVIVFQAVSLIVSATNNTRINEQGDLIKQLQERRIVDELREIRGVIKRGPQ